MCWKICSIMVVKLLRMTYWYLVVWEGTWKIDRCMIFEDKFHVFKVFGRLQEYYFSEGSRHAGSFSGRLQDY